MTKIALRAHNKIGTHHDHHNCSCHIQKEPILSISFGGFRRTAAPSWTFIIKLSRMRQQIDFGASQQILCRSRIFRYLYFTWVLFFFPFSFYPLHLITNICTFYSSRVGYFSFNAFSQDHKTDFNLSAYHAADVAKWNNPERERSEWGEKTG